MSIVTRTGDKGTTALMYGRRVMKNHAQVEAYGAVDELNAALGLARVATPHESLLVGLVAIQKDLVVVMGELAVSAEDLERYVRDGHSVVSPELVQQLERMIAEVEGQTRAPADWVMPGDNPVSAALDLARTVCRRAERRVCAVHQAGALRNPQIIIFLNRLADLLWLLARWAEDPANRK
jgi:cob(I)alamin adenosyltransferase